MRILEWRLAARGYRVSNIDYSSRVARIEDASDAVFAQLDERLSHSSPVHFVTHSLGGLVLRCLLARHEIASAGRAVMLAPPNRGSELADRLRSLGLFARLLGPLAAQLGTRPEDLPQRLPSPTIPFGVVAGSRWLNPAGPFWLEGAHDGTVSVASTRLEGMSDHLVLPFTHTFIMNRSEVARQVDAFLQAGRFAHPDADSARSPSR
ncbi:MAG: alpha/beta hydrolase [Deltaproteobacteria bacterium]|jgi:pimeloyl-ACP methyl ester carboxylesterase|nr:alpha/beta hydrolase [Deltaproteobacteria bacterium]